MCGVKKLYIGIVVIGVIVIVILASFFIYQNKSSRHNIIGTVYYVSNSGNDSNDGMTKNSSWETLDKVNSFNFNPGDIICFKKGDEWRGQLIPKGGDTYASIVYTSYGNYFNNKPQILGSISKSLEADWTKVSDNIWSTKVSIPDVGNIILNGNKCGKKAWSAEELLEQNQFYFKTSTEELLIYSTDNPAKIYQSIECALSRYIIDQANKRWIVYDGLSLKYGAAHGIGGVNTSNITIRNCDISYIGGADFYKDGVRHVRYGNGIEFWGSADNNLVEYCKIWEIYDAALTNQNSGQVVTQNNITYRRNRIWNSEYSFEYWNEPSESSTNNIKFINNYCYNAGMGWGHEQRPDKCGRHICFFSNSSSINNFKVSGNTFKYAEEFMVYINFSFNNIRAVDISKNTYYQSIDKEFAICFNRSYGCNDFKTYLANEKIDQGSQLMTLQ